MKISFIILFLFLSPSFVSAEPEFFVSCDTVERIQVWRLRGQVWKHETTDGYHYILLLYLNKPAEDRLAALVETVEEIPVFVDGHRFDTKRINLKTKRGVLLSDAPVWDTFRGSHAIITKKRAEDAFAAARAVCPEKAPRKLLTDGS